MDKNIKIVFGIIGVALLCGVNKLTRLDKEVKRQEQLIDLLGNWVENIDRIQDIEYQRRIDVRFEEIADNFDD